MLACLIGCVCSATPAVEAQPQPEERPAQEPLSQYDGRLVREIRFEGLDRVQPQFARNQIRLQEGRPFDSDVASGDVRRLHSLAEFGRVEVAVERFDDGSVAVVYTFEEAPIIQDIQVAGNRRLNDEEIAQEVRNVNLVAGVPVDQFRLDRARRAIEDLYRRSGFFNARVTVDQEELEDGIVLFRVREGQRVRVTAIRFEGAKSLSHDRLRGEIDTETAGILRQGVLDDDILDRDVDALIQFYQGEGFLDARVDREVTLSPDGREAIVTFLVDEGPRYHLREVIVRDAQRGEDGEPEPLALSAEQVVGLISMKPGDVYSASAADQAVQTVRDAYWRMGYVNAQVSRRELRDPERPRVDLLMTIAEGQRFRTGEVIVQGNALTRQDVIRRRVQVKPDRPLDRTAVNETQQRLRNTRLFNQQGVNVVVQDEDPEQPGHRDVLVEVDETDTGQITFLAAASADSGLIGSFSIRERNFDITNPPRTLGDLLERRAFRGGGQTLELVASPGTEITNFSASLTEPSLFETDNSLSVGGSFRDRLFETYDEQRLRAQVSAGRRFGERWEAQLSLRADNVELDDFDDDAPVDVFDVADSNAIFGVGAQVTRTTVPPTERRQPTRGSRTVLGVEQIFGDFTFNKLSAEHTFFLPIKEDAAGRMSVLSMNLRTSYIPQTGEPPVYERFFLGGNSFRGFDFRGVSPRGVRNDTGELGDDPVGGSWAFFAGLEYEEPIFQRVISGVVFLDSGTVEQDIGFSDYRVSVGVGLRIRVPQLGPVPLAFDFGVPLIKEPEDETRIFSFSADIPF